MGLVDYISRNPFARAKKISTYDEHIVVATISKIRNSMKNQIKNKQNALRKFNSILKILILSPSFHSKQSFAPQMHTSLTTNLQISTKPLASQLLLSQRKVPFASHLTLSNSIVNPHLNPPSASQIPPKVRKSQFVLNNCKVKNSINECASKEVHMSDSKECEHSEQLYPIKAINDIKSNNPPKIAKKRRKITNSKV